ncbi:MAG: hypothetical protein RLY49_254 [Candidatus Parcubacteria bacterium]|jgi:hypothetical protein
MKRYKIEYPSIDDINFMNSVASELFDPEDETMVEPNLDNALDIIKKTPQTSCGVSWYARGWK